MMFTNGQINGLIIPKYVADEMATFINKIITEKPSDYKSENMSEILPASYLFTFWKKLATENDMYNCTECFWGINRDYNKTIPLVKRSILEKDRKYICVKKCDGPNNPLLKMIHQEYMVKRLNDIRKNQVV